MRHRPETTATGWALAKAGVLLVVFLTLAGFTVFSHVYSHARAGRIRCLDNQRATAMALLAYQADNAGSSPANLDALNSGARARRELLGRCPADTAARYANDDASSDMICPNPEHRSHALAGFAAGR